MKKMIVLTLLVLVAFLLPSITHAKDKVWVDIQQESKTISYRVGDVEYISTFATPDVLKEIRVWYGTDYKNYVPKTNTWMIEQTHGDPQKRPMGMTEIAEEWTKYSKKFNTIQKQFGIRAIK